MRRQEKAMCGGRQDRSSVRRLTEMQDEAAAALLAENR